MDLQRKLLLRVKDLEEQRKPPALRSGIPKKGGSMILHEPTQVLARKRPVRNNADVARQVTNLPRFPDRHARWQWLVVEPLQLAPTPDALFEDGPEGKGIEHVGLDSGPGKSPSFRPRSSPRGRAVSR